MMDFFNSLIVELKRNGRDKNSLMLMLLLPIVLIFILGSALSSSFAPSSIGVTNVLVLYDDQGKGKEAFMEFLQIKEIKELIHSETIGNLTDGIAKVKKGEAVGIIVIPKDFSEALAKGERAEIQVYDSAFSPFRRTVVHNIVESFVSGSNTYHTANALGMRDFQYVTYKMMSSEAVALSGTRPRSIDYYAVTMMVMTIMYGAYYGNSAIRSGKQNKTDQRLKSTPARQSSILGGIMCGTVLSVFLQSIVLITFSKLVYHVSWGNDLGFILLVCLGTTLLAVSIGVFLGSALKSSNASSALISVLVMLCTFLSGGYVPLREVGKPLEFLMNLTPNFHAQEALFAAMFTGIDGKATAHVGVLYGAALVVFLFSAIFGRRTVQ